MVFDHRRTEETLFFLGIFLREELFVADLQWIGGKEDKEKEIRKENE